MFKQITRIVFVRDKSDDRFSILVNQFHFKSFLYLNPKVFEDKIKSGAVVQWLVRWGLRFEFVTLVVAI